MPKKSLRDVRNEYTQTYDLKSMRTLAEKLKKKLEITKEWTTAASFEINQLSEKEDQEIPKLEKLKKEPQLEKFRTKRDLHMAIIDLNTENMDHFKCTGRYFEHELAPTLPWTKERTPRPERDPYRWAIDIFCCRVVQDRIQSLEPVAIVLILLEFLSVQLEFRKRYTGGRDWSSIKVDVVHKPTKNQEGELPYYQFVMEILSGLVHQMMEDCPEQCLYLIFSGVYVDDGSRLWLSPQLARFMVDMARLVWHANLKVTDSKGTGSKGTGEVKCIFSGVGLLDERYAYGFLKKFCKEGIVTWDLMKREQTEKSFKGILMLDWKKKENSYQRIQLPDRKMLSTRPPDPQKGSS